MRLKNILLLISFSLIVAYGYSQNPTDACGAGVATLTSNATCVNTAYTLSGGYANGGQLTAAGCTAGNDKDDGWYQFVATGTSTTVQITGNEARTIAAYTGSCGAGQLACNQAAAGTTASITFATSCGTTYYLQVHRRSGNNSATMTGNICISASGACVGPANDLCANATTLNCGDNLTNQTTVGSSNVAHNTGCTMGNYGVWYTFTGDGNISTITSTGDANWNHEMAIVSGNCGSTANVTCVDNAGMGGTETYSFTTVNGLNYLIYIACDFSGTGTGCTSGFDISRTCTPAPSPPANDLCANATTLNCGDNLTNQTTVGSTSAAHNTGCGVGNYGVWYTFTGDGNNSTITSTADAGWNHEMSIVSGNCGSTTNVACIDNNGAGGTETYTFTTVNGLNYLIYIACDFTGTGPGCTSGFDISRTCTVPPPAPPNDLCPNATTLNCGDNLIGETTVGATNVNHGTGCAMNNYGVWYTFVGDGNQSTISVDPDAGFNTEVAITSGNCGALTNIACANTSGAGGIDTYVFTTVNLTTYYIYVAFSGNGGYPNANSGFDISRTCAVPPPASLSDCIGGASICNDSSFVGNASGSGNVVDLNAGNDGCLSGEHQTSWYFFEAQTAGTLEFLIDPVNGTDDYDFAMWGPYPSGSTPASVCIPGAPPVRCSYAAGAPPPGGTGLQTGAGDNSEGTGGDHYVDPLFLNAGDVYVLVIDNYSGSSSPFDMDLTLSGGLSLDCTQLPVELLSFSGHAGEDGHYLNWITSTEINNDHFDIERSFNGVTFQKIGEVQGNGNSNTTIEYSYIDAAPLKGLSYYRLKQVDYNGAYEFSNTITINDRNLTEIGLFPNPTQGKMNFSFSSMKAQDYKIIVSDLSKTIYEENHFIEAGNQILRFELFQDLAPGFYLIKIVDSNGSTIKLDKVVRK